MTFWKRIGISKKRLYADAAAGTPLSARSKKELVRLLELYGNAGALHKEAVEAKNEIESARKKIADAIGAHADEIIFTGSGTEANNLALTGLLTPLKWKHKTISVLTSSVEHSSVLEPLRALTQWGVEVIELPVDSAGLVNPKELAEKITDTTVLVSIQLVNSEIGAIQPVKEIAKEIRKIKKERINGLPLYIHTDASQAPLWMKIGVEQLGVDLLTLDAQKILGPKGIGALSVRRGVTLEPLIRGGGQENSLRAGTQNTPLIGAFAVALEDAQRGIEARAEQVAEIRDYCFAEIKTLIPDAMLNGAAGEDRVANNLNISIPNLEAQMAVIALDAEGIAASTRSACGEGNEQINMSLPADRVASHVIKAIGVSPELAGTAIRITFLPDITKADVKRIAQTLQKIAQRYKKVV